MPHPIITQYPFNHSSSIGVEAKSLEFLWEKADMTNGIHRADFYHFIWVKGGELCLMVDFEELRLKEEDAFLIAPGQVCQFHLYPHLHSRPEGYSLLFVPEFLGEATTDAQLLHQLLNSNPLARKATSLQQLPIDGLLQQLLCELDRENDDYQLVIARSCLRILLAEVARRLPDERGKSNELAQRFFNEVEEHHHRWYNVSDYLPILATQEKLLSQSVRSACGMTPKAYIDQRRLLEAKRFLSYSTRAVKEIAFSLGFDEPTNFNKFFRKHTGISPIQFRMTQTSD